MQGLGVIFLRKYSFIKWCRCIIASLFFVGSLSFFPVMAASLVGTHSSGSIGYTYRISDYSTGDSDGQQVLRADMNNRFFVWRDWFMVGNSNLSFSQVQTTVATGRSDNSSITGSVGFTVLPQSSTPFGFSYTRSDSKVDTDFNRATGPNTPSLDDSAVTESLVMHQSLVGKRYRLKLKYSDDRSRSVLRGKYGASALSVSGLYRETTGVLRASVSQKNETTYDSLDRESQYVRVNHNYTGFKKVTVRSSASISKIQQSPQEGVSTAASYGVELTQAATSVIWKSLDKKLMVTSALRFSGIKSVVASTPQDNSNRTLSGSLGVTYQLTQKTSLFINSNSSQSGVSGQEVASTSNQLGVTYRSGEIKLDAWSYDWRTDARLGQRVDDGEESSTSSFNLGHGVGRRWGIARSQYIYLNGSQDFSSNTQSNQVRQRLSHRGSLGWRQSLFSVNRRAQFQVSDQRDLDGVSALQTLTADLSQQSSLNRRIKLNGSLNYQLTSYQSVGSSVEGSTSENSAISINGGLSYLNPFSISGMGFTSNYRYSQSVASQDQLTVQQSWSNKMNYRVGKIDVSLQYLYREARKISYNAVFFNVRRVF